MKHSFERLSDLVHDVIKHRGEIVSEEHRLFGWPELFRKENQNVRKYMLRRSLKLADKEKISAFIDQCHTLVIKLSDYVYLEDASDLTRPSNNSIPTSILKGLQRILNFIEDHFKEYINLDLKPLYEIDRIQKQLGKEYKRVRRKLNSSEDGKLLNLLFLPLVEISLSKEKLTSRNLNYIRSLLEKLDIYINEKESIGGEDYSLIDLMVAMNFNTGRFFHYLIQNIEEKIKKLCDEEKIIELRKVQKRFKQNIELSTQRLNPEAFWLKEQIIHWINEELISVQSGRLKIKRTGIPKGEKPKFEVSVETLGTLIRAAKDSKFLTGSDAIIIAYFMEYFQSVSGITLSEKSFRKKIYQSGAASTGKALEVLDEMRKWVLTY